jgi:hypothetical protein
MTSAQRFALPARGQDLDNVIIAVIPKTRITCFSGTNPPVRCTQEDGEPSFFTRETADLRLAKSLS